MPTYNEVIFPPGDGQRPWPKLSCSQAGYLTLDAVEQNTAGEETPTAGSLRVTGTIYVDGGLTATGNLSVVGIANLEGNTQVQGSLQVTDFIDAPEVRQNGVRLTSSQWQNDTQDISYLGGKVGIGIAHPTQALEVNGAVKATDFIKGTIALVSSQWADVAGGINYSGGSVGIGVESVSKALDVAGQALFRGARWAGPVSGVAGTVVGFDPANTGGTGFLFAHTTTGQATRLWLDGNPIIFAPLAVERMRITSAGNVGIGTTTPSVKLHIVGGTDAETNNQGGFLVIGDLNGANLAMDDNEILARSNAQKAPLHFQANGGDVWVHSKQGGTDFIIKDNGFVGVGISNPGAFIHVRGGATCNGARWVDNSSLANKKNVAALSLDEALTTLAGLNAVTFTYKNMPEEKRCVGFIAEDVPELVADAKRQGLSAMDIVGVLTKVVQHQQQEIAALRIQLESK